MKRLNIDILERSEVRWPNSGKTSTTRETTLHEAEMA